MSTRELGSHAEGMAAAFLQMKGYAVLARNYQFHRNEIDIVMEDGSRLVFVEVKCRSGRSRGTPREAVGREKMRRIVRASRGFVAETGREGRPLRFDVVEVRVERGGLTAIVEHIVGAFGGDLRGW